MQALEYVMKKTMYEKIWDSHLVVDVAGQAPLIYVDRHLDARSDQSAGI